MRNLNIGELNEVQGGGIAIKWAYKLGELLANGLTLYEASKKLEIDPAHLGYVDADCFNAMGDYTNNISVK